MANTSFSSGFATGYSITSDWKAKKEKKAMIKKEEDEAKAWAMELGSMFDRDKNSGTGISQQEYENGYKVAMIAGTEQLNFFKDLYGNSMNMTKEKIQEELDNVRLMREMYAGADLKDRDGLRDMIKGAKYDKSKRYAEVLMKQWDAEDAAMAKDKAKEPEYFTSLQDLRKQYGEEARGQFASGKGWVYTGEEKVTPKSSDYINAINTLSAVAKGKTDEEFQAFKTNYEKETGINLGKISRTDLLQIDPEEIKKANFDTVFFGARGIMTEYSELAEALDEEAKREILNKWKLRRPLMNYKDQLRGDEYMASIGVDMNMPDEPVDTGDEEEKESPFSISNIMKLLNEWDEKLKVGQGSSPAPKRRGE